MKNLSILLAAFSLGTAPVQAEGQKPVQIEAVEEVRGGSQEIAHLRSAFAKGDYDLFFKEMDDSYEAAKDQGQLEQLASMRVGHFPEWAEWEERAHEFQKGKNQELLAAVAGDNSFFADKVRNAASGPSSDEEEKAISRIASFRQLGPGKGESNDENALIALDLEYEFKSLDIDPNLPALEKKKKYALLKMEMLERMGEASEDFQDESLKKAVAIYKKNFDKRLSRSWDIADLNALANGRTAPADALEEKIATLLRLHQEKFSEMTHSFIAEHESR